LGQSQARIEGSAIGLVVPEGVNGAGLMAGADAIILLRASACRPPYSWHAPRHQNCRPPRFIHYGVVLRL